MTEETKRRYDKLVMKEVLDANDLNEALEIIEEAELEGCHIDEKYLEARFKHYQTHGVLSAETITESISCGEHCHVTNPLKDDKDV